MSESGGEECVGKLSPARVVQCAEGSSTVCWMRAEVVEDDGSTIEYECCGGGGRAPEFTVRKGILAKKTVRPDDVPDGLVWSRRMV